MVNLSKKGGLLCSSFMTVVLLAGCAETNGAYVTSASQNPALVSYDKSQECRRNSQRPGSSSTAERYQVDNCPDGEANVSTPSTASAGQFADASPSTDAGSTSSAPGDSSSDSSGGGSSTGGDSGGDGGGDSGGDSGGSSSGGDSSSSDGDGGNGSGGRGGGSNSNNGGGNGSESSSPGRGSGANNDE